MRSGLVPVAVLCLLAGCTHKELHRSTLRTASTLTEMQYQMVLENVAMLSCHPALLPWHVRFSDGVVQVNDAGRFNGESLLLQNGSLGFTELGPRVSRNITGQWEVGPVTNPSRLKALRTAYRELFGLPPADEPELPEEEARETDHDGEGVLENGREVENSGEPNPDDNNARAEQEVDIPVGWFHLGRKRDIPRDACFVANYGKRYAWVTPEGIDGLSEFTLIVLGIVELDPEEVRPAARGIIFGPR